MHFEISLIVKDKSHLGINFDPKTDLFYITGSIDSLGNWDLKKAILLNPSTHIKDDALKWSINIDLEQNESQFEYKYFIVKRTNHSLFLEQIESNRRLFKLDESHRQSKLFYINDYWRFNYDSPLELQPVFKGWLLNDQFELHFNFYNKPLKYLLNNSTNSLAVSCFRLSEDGNVSSSEDYLASYIEYNQNGDLNDNNYKAKALNSADFYGTYRFRSLQSDLRKLMFKIEIDKIGEAIFKLSENLLKNSLEIIDVPLYHVETKEFIGSLKIELLLVLNSNKDFSSLKDVFNYQFENICVPAGHRGMGVTFDGGSLPKIKVVENTIPAFTEALKRGAKMVEFDVLLTKDKQSIIYHDFSACLENHTNPAKYFLIGVNQLSLAEIRSSKVYSDKILKKSPLSGEESNFTSKDMFPTLSEIFEQVDEQLAFDIEIKYPLDLEGGTSEADSTLNWLERNKYIDIILNELLHKCKITNRCVILSTFDPYLCIMTRLKQNRFPVLLLTNGVTQRWEPYLDLRCKSTKISTVFAKHEGLNGVALHSEEFFNNPELFDFLERFKCSNFLFYSWGQDLNDLKCRQLFKQHHFDGLIYDRVDERSVHRIDIQLKLNESIHLDYNFNPETDSFYITGSLDSLGNWDLNKAVRLKLHKATKNEQFKWSTTFDLDRNESHFDYKYFIAKKSHNGNSLFLQQIESNTRKFKIDHSKKESKLFDSWRMSHESPTEIQPVVSGWLLKNQFELQFNFYKKPLNLSSSNEGASSISIFPYADCSNIKSTKIYDYIFSYTEFSEKDVRHNSKDAKSLVSSEYYGIYKLRLNGTDPKNFYYRVEINSTAECFIKLPKSILDNSVSIIDLPLHCLNTKKPVGSLRVQIVLITSLNDIEFNLVDDPYKYVYKNIYVPTGHRGRGITYDADKLEKINVMENTIPSFNEALNKGAKMVEFDVVLTRDNQSIIYHDFAVCIKNSSKSESYYEAGINQLTYEEIKSSKLYGHKILVKLSQKPFDEEHFTSKEMFAKLNELFDKIDERLGFDVEIKYPLDLENGDNELDSNLKWMDRNKYSDIILKELLTNCRMKNRCVILTTFDPFLCIMLRMKQNRFPVLFLTNGITNKWKPYLELQCKTTRISSMFVKATDVQGVVLHAEELCVNRELFDFLRKNIKQDKYLIYSWGQHLNEASNRELFKQTNLFDGLIYDRIDENH